MNPILKFILRTVKVIAIIAVIFVVLIVSAVSLINSSSIQDRLLAYATEMLQEKLQTKVEIDSIRIGFFSDDIRIYHLMLEDQQQRPMLQMKQLNAEIKMMPLLFSKEVILEEVKFIGLHAKLYKPSSPDSVANYQFVLDAFKPSAKKEKEKKKEESDKPKKKFSLDLNNLIIEDVDLVFNDKHASLGSLRLHKNWKGRYSGELRQVESSWVHIKKRDSTRVDNHLLVDAITYEEVNDNKRTIAIDSVHWSTDNHLPHKRVNKPKRGWYDNGHMNVVAHLKAELTHADKDSICGKLLECDVNDIASGLHITDLHLGFKQQAEKLYISDAVVCMKNTKLTFAKGEIQLPSKKQGRPFLFHTSDITGTTLLTDISKPFAPVLKNFKLPLWLSTKFSGTDSTLVFRDVIVKTTDNKLQVRADGGIEGLKDKYKLNVHFNIHKTTVQGNSKERIINQFTVRKFMMKQLHTLGTIHYTGSFNVLYKKVQFRGTLGTACGSLNFVFQLDGLNKYLTGHVKTRDFELGKAMDYPGLGKTSCSAGFRFDISKPRTAQMRRLKGGKLPIGQVDALVEESRLEGVRFSNIAAHIVSDGAIAEGKINMKGKLADILCSFSFTNTDEMKKTKIKPGIRFHLFDKKSDEEKAVQKAEKEKKKAEKAALKEQKKAEKAALKEQKKAEKAALKEQKKAEKAAKKEAKRREKEAKKLAESQTQ